MLVNGDASYTVECGVAANFVIACGVLYLLIMCNATFDDGYGLQGLL